MLNIYTDLSNRRVYSPRVQEVPAGTSRIEIYEEYKLDMEEAGKPVMVSTFFNRLWREHFPAVVVPQCSKFAKCDQCTSLSGTYA
jgi:hypothetical protein